MSHPPPKPSIYHIVHVDRLSQIIRDGFLYADVNMRSRTDAGTNIGLPDIKERRAHKQLASHPDLAVGACVPFYFCPRSVMLYVIYKRNHPNLIYRGGQDPIVHLELDLYRVHEWCLSQPLRWAFTLGNAGAAFHEDRCDLARLNEIRWDAIDATDWHDPDVKEGKQSEFLVENRVDWALVERIGVRDQATATQVYDALSTASHRPTVSIEPSWYY